MYPLLAMNFLYWSDLDNNFFDMSLYAAEGNISHMIEQAKLAEDSLFSDEVCLVENDF
jgi:8-oxo-dGTP diphosphatase